ncbi:hypothetical protein, partial [Legionella qingyii]
KFKKEAVTFQRGKRFNCNTTGVDLSLVAGEGMVPSRDGGLDTPEYNRTSKYACSFIKIKDYKTSPTTLSLGAIVEPSDFKMVT